MDHHFYFHPNSHSTFSAHTNTLNFNIFVSHPLYRRMEYVLHSQCASHRMCRCHLAKQPRKKGRDKKTFIFSIIIIIIIIFMISIQYFGCLSLCWCHSHVYICCLSFFSSILFSLLYELSLLPMSVLSSGKYSCVFKPSLCAYCVFAFIC